VLTNNMAEAASSITTTSSTWAPWHVLLHWAPFKIDALGLVTLLGAEEVNAAVGRLVSSAYLEYLPFLGAYVIAGDQFTDKHAGWNLYNITQGIHTTDLSAWLTRWMLSQKFEPTRNFVVWKVTPPRSRTREIVIGSLIGIVLNGFLLALTILSKDWYGLANTIAMILAVIVRLYVIGQQRHAVDVMIDEAIPRFGPPTGDNYETKRYAYNSWQHAQEIQKQELRHRKHAMQTAKSNRRDSSQSSTASKPVSQAMSTVPSKPSAKQYRDKEESWIGKPIKVLIVQSDSKAVTFWMPNELLIPPSLFIEGPIIQNPTTYGVFRAIGWVAFAVHIVAIGMADLATQIYTVFLIVVPTLLLVQKTGCDDSDWASIFRGWKRDLFHKPFGVRPSVQKPVAEQADSSRFRFVRSCYIGRRLKAEIYEWPMSYELHQEEDQTSSTSPPPKRWASGGPGHDSKTGKENERSRKRQDLYAWLALSHDEEQSMDKWDLFPHIRKGNLTWWQTYKQKKHALANKRDAMGPQHSDEDADPLTFVANGIAGGDGANGITLFGAQSRTATFNFVHGSGSDAGQAGTQIRDRRHSTTGRASSAFPAAIESDEEDEDGKSAGDAAPSSLAPVTTHPLRHLDPSAAFTQSPTAANLATEAVTPTNEQPP
jgi:hypothetical protein